MLKATGILENWRIKNSTIAGNVYNDTRNRFPDGSLVRTSRINPDGVYEMGTIVQTMNSVYVLGKPL